MRARAGEEGRARKVRHVQNDDLRRRGTRADPVQERRVVLAKCRDLLIDVAVGFVPPSPPARAAVITFTSFAPANTVTSVASRWTNGISSSMKLPRMSPAVFLAEGLKALADDGGRNAQVQ